MVWMRNVTKAASIAGLFGWGTVSKSALDEKYPYRISVERPVTERPLAKDNIVSRKIINADDKTGLNLRLYQYQSCPFCCKVRAFLDYYGFSYEVIEVNPVTKTELKFTQGYKKVPVLRAQDDQYLLESSLVMSQMATYLVNPQRSLSEIMDMYTSFDTVDDQGKPCKKWPNKYFVLFEKDLKPADIGHQREEREWRVWVDDHFIHLISPNVYRSFDESLETFRQFEKAGEWDRVFTYIERQLAVYLGASVMYLIGKRLKKKHDINDERAALADACDKWMEALGARKFMGGDKPSLADLALYGAMNSFVNCRAFNEVIVAGKIYDWYQRIDDDVKNSRGRRAVAERSAAAKKE